MTDTHWTNPVTIRGFHVELVPLSMDHVESLCGIGLEPSIWAHNVNPVRNRSDMQNYVSTALANHAKQTALPFAIFDLRTSLLCGSTRFGNMDRKNRRLEIGWTWINPRWQRTAVNTETKLLLLRYAFDSLGCERVEFKTDVNNEKSRIAILRLGAQEEGILRSHMLRHDGSFRDTIYFSIIRTEWGSVQVRLQRYLDRH